MLTGTLITAAGFLPVGFAKSGTGEYVYSLFQVVGISLVLSWIVAVLFTPYLGVKLLKEHANAHHDEHAVYQKGFYLRFRRFVDFCLVRRGWVIGLTLAAFVGSIALFKLVPQQFFPASDRARADGQPVDAPSVHLRGQRARGAAPGGRTQG